MLPQHRLTRDAPASPRHRGAARRVWHALRWPRRVLGGALLVVGAAYAWNLGRVLRGDARQMTLADAWGVNLDSVALAAVARDPQARPAPILDSLLTQWVAQENRVHPYLVVRAEAERSSDVTLVLNPAAYRVYGAEWRELVLDLTDRWRVVLASAGAEWPAGQGFLPGLRIARRDTTASDPRGAFRTVIVADTRDGRRLFAPIPEDAIAPTGPAGVAP